MPEYKICNRCEESKSLDNFYKRKKSRDGFRHQCKQCISELSKVYHDSNKERMKLKNKIWRENNKDVLKNNSIKFHNKNPNYHSDYYQKNRVKINERYNNRRIEDDLFRLKENVRNLIKNSLYYKGFSKSNKTTLILGCDISQFKSHIESQWENWMNWDNYGKYNGEFNHGWDIDHIIPLQTAESEEDIINLNHFTNLQPLCSYMNRVIKRYDI